MTTFQCHYEALKVTRDAPPEVIRAAYRSLSQKHHPDKNIGNDDASRVMARLNFAYSVLSDAAQRELYDLQLFHEGRVHARHAGSAGSGGAAAGGEWHQDGFAQADAVGRQAGNGTGAWLRRIRRQPVGRNRHIAAATAVVLIVLGVLMFRSMWQEQQSMAVLGQAAMPMAAGAAAGRAVPVDEAGAQAAADDAARRNASGADTVHAPEGSGVAAGTAAPPAPAAAREHPDTMARASDFERLTVMLKSMGLGLHTLDSSTQARDARRPSTAAKPAEPDTPGAAASPAPAPVARLQATGPVGAETVRAREEAERPAVAEPVRGDTKLAAEAGRASAAPAAAGMAATATAAATAAAAAGAVPPQAVIADVRACVPPAYPVNAYSNGESGTVQLALLIGSDGRVIESKVQRSSGHSELNKAARKALSQCRFKVRGSEKQDEPVWTTLEYVFKLD